MGISLGLGASERSLPANIWVKFFLNPILCMQCEDWADVSGHGTGEFTSSAHFHMAEEALE